LSLLGVTEREKHEKKKKEKNISRYQDTSTQLLSTTTTTMTMTNLFSLPTELVRMVFMRIVEFEPWICSSREDSETPTSTITDEELVLYTRDALPINFDRIRRYVLGLSGEAEWLVKILRRHPYRLGDKVVFAVVQAVRRGNGRGEVVGGLERGRVVMVGGGEVRREVGMEMRRWHASVEEEEEDDGEVESGIPRKEEQTNTLPSAPTTAIIKYNPSPILKLTHHDLSTLTHPSPTTAQHTLLIAALLTTILHHRLALLSLLSKLDSDTPLPSIKPHSAETKDFATPRPDRPRSLSGSTIVDIPPHEESLSLSIISTVFSSEPVLSSGVEVGDKNVQWAEKTDTESKEEEVVVKRPKLSQYKQVSSGRVATLMDRFEKFHL
jgi:hypothetical protein